MSNGCGGLCVRGAEMAGGGVYDSPDAAIEALHAGLADLSGGCWCLA